jgi:hypothetical protein
MQIEAHGLDRIEGWRFCQQRRVQRVGALVVANAREHQGNLGTNGKVRGLGHLVQCAQHFAQERHGGLGVGLLPVPFGHAREQQRLLGAVAQAARDA